jgi:hypothetical protein
MSSPANRTALREENRPAIRPLERQVLRVLGVADFLSLKDRTCSRTSDWLALTISSPGSDGTPLLPSVFGDDYPSRPYPPI